MTPEARIPGWGWIILLGAWIGFGTLMLRESSLLVEASAAALFLAGSVYSIYHCWRNPYITLHDKFNWFAAILVTWILAATAYLMWWHLRGGTRTVQVASADRAVESATRFNELVSARKIALMGIVLTIAWLLLGASVLLFLLGRALGSPEVVVALTFGMGDGMGDVASGQSLCYAPPLAMPRQPGLGEPEFVG